jgi:uncharacterized protein YdhG (YjbR/CyaY superfamily)
MVWLTARWFINFAVVTDNYRISIRFIYAGHLMDNMTAKSVDIEHYKKAFPKDVQVVLEKVRQTIRKAAPGAVEAISYQMPTFKLNGKNLVHFAAWKNHIGFYPTPSGTERFKKELSRYKGAKGSVQFPVDKPIPYELIRMIVSYRVKESLKH